MLSASLLKRTLLSQSSQTTRQVRPSSAVWVSFTLISSLTVSVVSSVWRLTRVHLRLTTKRLSQLQFSIVSSSRSRPVVVVSSQISSLKSALQMRELPDFSSITRLRAVTFLRSTFLAYRKVSSQQWQMVSLQATRFLLSRLLSSTVLTIRSIQTSSHSRSAPAMHSVTLALRHIRFSLSLS